MTESRYEALQRADRACIWHPYAPATMELDAYPVAGASGVRLTLADGRELIDGMASWWCAIHGYNHPVLNRAVEAQLQHMSHVMFGGLTHEPAIRLAETLVDLTPPELDRVFFSDSGSVSVEVAVKMAIQYWHSVGRPSKQRFVALRSGYHGDTFAAMSLCDPVTGMHHLFGDTLTRQFFVPAPACGFGDPCTEQDTAELEQLLRDHADEIAAVVVEPVVQGAGGMRFYSPGYLDRARQLCDEHDVLLVFDEIATGFGRTGKLFALEHAAAVPDILCLGKSLTGGYMTLAATLCNERVSRGISEGEAGAFMHGPTFMANPLACATALASIKLLLSQPWQRLVQGLQEQMQAGLAPASALPNVTDVRVLGGVGVIELDEPVNLAEVQPMFVERGVWVRPFGRLVYAMPPFIMAPGDVTALTSAMVDVVETLSLKR